MSRRSDFLERMVLTLRDARESHDVLAIVARGLGFEFSRPCAAYELRDGTFRPVVASEVVAEREPIAASALDVEALRMRGVLRWEGQDLVAVGAEGGLPAIFALEGAREALSDDDLKFLRAVGAHAALALTTALSFEQLRRYAAEGAALTEAARTILGFTELAPLADALCKLALRLVHAERAYVYGRDANDLKRIGGATTPARRPTLPATLPSDLAEAAAALRTAAGNSHVHATPMLLPGADDVEHGGLLVTQRRRPFEKAELKLLESLVALAALAIRNIELYAQTVRANRALGESNAFKDDLMAMFAHDFKGPLTVISGFCELLLEPGDATPEEVRRNLLTIMEQSRRLAKLSEDALALAATQSAGFSLQRRRQDLVAFVEDAIRLIDGGNRISLEAETRPLNVPFDRARLRHAVDNVLANALKYSQERVEVRVRREADAATIAVADRGIGVPKADLTKIFERFGRASNARSRAFSGSGVGLYIAKKIVEVHGGSLTVASREGDGSTFTTALPLK
ncbi:MAG: hypothetical protein GIW95_03115 [Candidatus Eremiobacteraeota bacterium]|nr:hypothetical protein [Candidatus Eremiobacteraeota bacterium]